MAKNPLSRIRALEIIQDFMMLDGMEGLDYFVCGSIRRGSTEVGDIDCIVTNPFPSSGVSEKYKESGAKKSRTYNYKRAQINLWSLEPSQLGSGVMYATGNSRFNTFVRRVAIRQGYKLSQNGLFDRKSNVLIVSQTEKEIFNKLGFKFVPVLYRSSKNYRLTPDLFKLRSGTDRSYTPPLIGRVYDRSRYSKAQQSMLPPKVNISLEVEKGLYLIKKLLGDKDA